MTPQLRGAGPPLAAMAPSPPPMPSQPQTPPDAIIVSGPDFYRPHMTRLYGGYKRTKNLYGKATYQKDPDQGGAGVHEAFIYWSAVDMKWCIGPKLGASIKEVSPTDIHSPTPVPIYQVAEDVHALYPNLFAMDGSRIFMAPVLLIKQTTC